MNLISLVKGDFRLQWKYGFYGLYILLCALYVTILLLLPENIRGTAAVVMIFSDPAAMGLFFLGAMVLFEQSQHVVQSLAVSPVTKTGYVFSKLFSLSLVSTGAGLLIALLSGGGMSILSLLPGVFLGSLLFSAVGMILAARAATLNRFLLTTVPAEILIILPAIAWLFGLRPGLLLLHPGVCVIALLAGEKQMWIPFFVLLLWTAVFFLLAARAAGRMMNRAGGGV
jgi:fluoroquinolone transport system permease protein